MKQKLYRVWEDTWKTTQHKSEGWWYVTDWLTQEKCNRYCRERVRDGKTRYISSLETQEEFLRSIPSKFAKTNQ
jgi:hypothetical protein